MAYDLTKYMKWQKWTIAIDLLKEVYGTLQMFLFIQEEAMQAIGMSIYISYKAGDKDAVLDLVDHALYELIYPALAWINTYGYLIYPNNLSYTEFFIASEKSMLTYKKIAEGL